MKVICPQCESSFGDDDAGKVYKCRHCGEFFQVGEEVQKQDGKENGVCQPPKDQLMDFFEVPINSPAVCSDNSCPCGPTSIPYGGGYLYISESAVDFRRDARSAKELQIKAAAYIKSLGGGEKKYIVLDPTIYKAILVCEKAAKRRGLNLHVAAADAKHAWKTAKAPLRPTPMIESS